VNAEQKKRIAHEISNWKNACNCRAVQLTGDRMAALLQELIDAPETEPVARVTGYYAGYLSIETIDGRVLPAGTALYLAPPAPSVPDMPLSMEQFGGLVGEVFHDVEDARRIVACLNALAGVSTEHLEQYGLPDFAQKISDLAQQRDKLLAALEKCRDMVGHPDNIAFIDAAIADVKGQS